MALVMVVVMVMAMVMMSSYYQQSYCASSYRQWSAFSFVDQQQWASYASFDQPLLESQNGSIASLVLESVRWNNCIEAPCHGRITIYSIALYYYHLTDDTTPTDIDTPLDEEKYELDHPPLDYFSKNEDEDDDAFEEDSLCLNVTYRWQCESSHSDNIDATLPCCPTGWKPCTAPDDRIPPTVDPLMGEPESEEVDYPGKCGEFTFPPKFTGKGYKKRYLYMPYLLVLPHAYQLKDWWPYHWWLDHHLSKLGA